MYGFIVKKSFCDDWDNLLTVFLTNVMYMIIGVGGFIGILKIIELFFGFVVSADESSLKSIIDSAESIMKGETGINVTATNNDVNIPLLIGIIGVLIFVIFYCLNIIKFAWGEIAYKYADFDSANIVDFFKEIPGVLVDALLYTIFVVLVTLISLFSMWFYFFANESKISFFVGALLFWLDIFIILSLQWFVPLRSMFHNNFRKCLKKCFLIFFDNTWFSICVFFHTLVLMFLSIFPFIGFFPSIGGIGINKANALRIRMYKYDYLEEHPELKTKRQRSKIPWEELIYDDKETLGPRKLKSFLFPWKDEN